MDGGRELFKTLIEATGLPSEAVEQELLHIFRERGLDPDHVTMNQLREVLAIYLQATLLEAKSAR